MDGFLSKADMRGEARALSRAAAHGFLRRVAMHEEARVLGGADAEVGCLCRYFSLLLQPPIIFLE